VSLRVNSVYYAALEVFWCGRYCGHWKWNAEEILFQRGRDTPICRNLWNRSL